MVLRGDIMGNLGLVRGVRVDGAEENAAKRWRKHRAKRGKGHRGGRGGRKDERV